MDNEKIIDHVRKVSVVTRALVAATAEYTTALYLTGERRAAALKTARVHLESARTQLRELLLAK